MSSKPQKIPAEIIENAIQTKFLHCKYRHEGTCFQFFISRFFKVFKISIKFFLLIHLIPLLLFKRKDIKKAPLKTFKHTFINLFYSLMYISSGFALGHYFLCQLKNFKHHESRWHVAFSCGMGSFLGALFESKSRRQELSLFVLPKFLETLWNFLKHRRLVNDIPYGQNILFALAMSIIAYYYHKKDECIKHSYKQAFKAFWSIN